jgi:hypothetical protein
MRTSLGPAEMGCGLFVRHLIVRLTKVSRTGRPPPSGGYVHVDAKRFRQLITRINRKSEQQQKKLAEMIHFYVMDMVETIEEKKILFRRCPRVSRSSK